MIRNAASVFSLLALGLAGCGQAPPIAKLSLDQLRGLAARCDRYPPDGAARGPYDAKYCEAAIAAWSDSPIQMLRLPDQPAAPR